MWLLRPGDLADIDIDLPASALAHIEDLERASLVANYTAAVGWRLHSFGVLNDDSYIRGALWGAQNRTVCSSSSNLEIAL